MVQPGSQLRSALSSRHPSSNNLSIRVESGRSWQQETRDLPDAGPRSNYRNSAFARSRNKYTGALGSRGMKPRPNYGIDSPHIIAGELVAGAGIIALAIAFPHLLGLPSLWVGLAVGLLLLNSAIGMIYYSKVGKLRIRDELLGSIPWRGDETVVDVGCGRGLLLVGAARRLTAG